MKNEMHSPKVSIIIPAWDEVSSIGDLVRQVNIQLPTAEIMVVDDGSTDGTADAAAENGARVIRHPYNMGNGAAVKSGIRAASGDILVFIDGDGQHDPMDINDLTAWLENYDMAVGARDGMQQASKARGFMNTIFNRLATYVTGFPIADLTSGFRAVRARTARNLLPLLPNGYSWPTTSTLVLLRSGMSVRYAPINARPRLSGRSRIRPIRDGIRFLMIILKICTLYSPFRIFLPVSGMMFLLGALNYAYTYFTDGRFTNMSALMFSAAVIIFMMGLISEQISQISLLRQQMKRGEDRSNHDPAQGSDRAD
jgi:glycosyltransferase involved in cell wall biosynthesis